MCQVCGIIFSVGGGGPDDHEGCRLQSGHIGPHEFVAKGGEVIQWETDWDCDCADCLSGDGDFCTVYWSADEMKAAERAQDKQVDAGQKTLF